MDDSSVLQPVDTGAEVQVNVDVLGSLRPSVGQLSSPAQPSGGARGRKGDAILDIACLNYQLQQLA